jgi:uncharacterized membrane protein YidH (DUF202 family)
VSELKESIELEPDVSTRLAVERIRVAYERTMLAWVRTATALITFGFGVSKFSEQKRSNSAGIWGEQAAEIPSDRYNAKK